MHRGERRLTHFADQVPQDGAENVEYRRWLLSEAAENLSFQRQVIEACHESLPFWVDSFVYAHHPKSIDKPKVVPLILYEYQRKAMSEMQDCLGKEDAVIEKSRDMGATYCLELLFLHRVLFHDNEAYLITSAGEDLVEKAGDERALFYKLDFFLRYLPSWMHPVRGWVRNKMTLMNKDLGGQITGCATGPDIGRGGRKTAVGLDEFASVPNGNDYLALAALMDVTDCVLYNSTPKGKGNAYYERVIKPGIARKIRMHWSQHPEKSAGLYSFDKKTNRVNFIDEDYRWQDYEFVEDGKLRSPWYDYQCKRRNNEAEIAQELDINYGIGDHAFFSGTFIETLQAKHAAAPTWKGDFQYDEATCKPDKDEAFLKNPRGAVSMWMTLDTFGRPANDRRYVVSCDISAGTGASNSVLVVGDCKTGKKVLSLEDSHIDPLRFGGLAVAMAYFFETRVGKAFLIWESNGPGRSFGKRVIELKYPSIYMRASMDKVHTKKGKVYGFHTTTDSKRIVLTDLREALSEDVFIDPDDNCLNEMHEIVRLASGRIEHQAATKKHDPSGAGDSHADRVMATALLWHGMKEKMYGSGFVGGLPEDRVAEEAEAEYGSFDWRMQRLDRAEKEEHSFQWLT